MKSSVASRKQRFWALLLAVVMVVGLLPTAGVKAVLTPTEYEFDSDVLSDEIPEGTVLNVGDVLKGTFKSAIQGEGEEQGRILVGTPAFINKSSAFEV